ncbi:hypothetical protein LXL04_033721 [Taraxacum kok-saghyz]
MVRFRNSCSRFCISLLGQYSSKSITFSSSQSHDLDMPVPPCEGGVHEGASSEFHLGLLRAGADGDDRFRLLEPAGEFNYAARPIEGTRLTTLEILVAVGPWVSPVAPATSALVLTLLSLGLVACYRGGHLGSNQGLNSRLTHCSGRHSHCGVVNPNESSVTSSSRSSSGSSLSDRNWPAVSRAWNLPVVTDDGQGILGSLEFSVGLAEIPCDFGQVGLVMGLY